MRRLLLFLTVLLTAGRAAATTWDEPWAEQVIRGASSFVLAKVTAADEKGATLQILKTLGGVALNGEVAIAGFYALDLCSTSGDGPELQLKGLDSCYFFLKQNDKGACFIATPTSGFAPVSGGKVVATYRHSYHQASVPVELYEQTMSSIFSSYHQKFYNQGFFAFFIQQQLVKPPAGLTEAERATFFAQHVALECIYHLRIPVDEKLILPFLNDTANFHNQVSAARALVATPSETVREALLQVIGDPGRDGFVKLMCIRTLAGLDAKPLKERLAALAKRASGEAVSFGGNLMDPRICTRLPSVKEALQELAGRL